MTIVNSKSTKAENPIRLTGFSASVNFINFFVFTGNLLNLQVHQD